MSVVKTKVYKIIIGILLTFIGYMAGAASIRDELHDHKLEAGHPVLEERQISFESEVKEDLKEIKETLRLLVIQ